MDKVQPSPGVHNSGGDHGLRYGMFGPNLFTHQDLYRARDLPRRNVDEDAKNVDPASHHFLLGDR